MSSSQQPFRLAVIGSGPAGVYAAETLLRSPQVKNGELEVSIDLFDRFPAPFGLIRYGVAPDHPRIKGIITALHRILGRGDIRFLGDVEFGTDLTAEDLRLHYDAVVFATGALKDAELSIPGIELEGSHGAADFVAWYDGNPDYPRTWELDAEQVAVIGNGNVALDVARVLSKSADELLRTEIPQNVYEGLQSARTTDVHIFGRRGPAQTKFSPLEARELAHPKGLQVVMDPRDVEQITEAEWEAIKADKRTDQVVQTFVGWLEEQQRREAAGEEPTDREGGPVRAASTCTSGTVPSRCSARTARSPACASSAPAWMPRATSRAPARWSTTRWAPSTAPSATTAPSCPASRTIPAAA